MDMAVETVTDVGAGECDGAVPVRPAEPAADAANAATEPVKTKDLGDGATDSAVGEEVDAPTPAAAAQVDSSAAPATGTEDAVVALAASGTVAGALQVAQPPSLR